MYLPISPRPLWKYCNFKQEERNIFCTKCGKGVTKSVAYVQPAMRDSRSSQGMIIMILGIVALASLVTGSMAAASLPASIVAIIMGFLRMKETKAAGIVESKARLGLILGGVALGVNIFTTISSIILVVLYILYYSFSIGNKLVSYLTALLRREMA